MAFLAVVAVHEINNLRAINTLNSSNPVASTNIYFIINYLRAALHFLQCRFCRRLDDTGLIDYIV